MSDRGEAERLRARAAEYLARATELENRNPPAATEARRR
jgi:hypothetical protein